MAPGEGLSTILESSSLDTWNPPIHVLPLYGIAGSRGLRILKILKKLPPMMPGTRFGRNSSSRTHFSVDD